MFPGTLDFSDIAVSASGLTLVICLIGGIIKNIFENTKMINTWNSGYLFYSGTCIFHIICSCLLALTFIGNDAWQEFITLISIIVITTFGIILDIKYSKELLLKIDNSTDQLNEELLILVWFVLIVGIIYIGCIMVDKGIIKYDEWTDWVAGVIVIYIVTKVISLLRVSGKNQ
ncbi:MAG: hypothetical protein A2Y24_08240 [Clostridiales bacterium GWE2_32_10]|nr:MAG: hypothetical protein A2Y24_08240 [Clostridiales bacterium GWE2_32_10]HBY19736.1 hypothetical protein [Clostridiales bacterium]